MNDRTLAAALGGTMLVVASARSVTSTTDRGARISFEREIARVRHTWRRRFSHAGAGLGAVLGLFLLLRAARSYRHTSEPDASTLDVPAPS